MSKTKIPLDVIKARLTDYGIFEKGFSFLNYVSCEEVYLENEFGIVKAAMTNLKKGYVPNIQTAVDKNEYFKNQSCKVNLDSYDYSLVIYVKWNSKVSIICPTHGVFQQTPNAHLSGKGCTQCSLLTQGHSKTNFKQRCLKNNNGLGFLYVIKCFNDKEEFLKVGITSKSVIERFKYKLPYKFEVLNLVEDTSDNIHTLETFIKNYYKSIKYIPLIHFEGHTECFKVV